MPKALHGKWLEIYFCWVSISCMYVVFARNSFFYIKKISHKVLVLQGSKIVIGVLVFLFTSEFCIFLIYILRGISKIKPRIPI